MRHTKRLAAVFGLVLCLCLSACAAQPSDSTAPVQSESPAPAQGTAQVPQVQVTPPAETAPESEAPEKTAAPAPVENAHPPVEAGLGYTVQKQDYSLLDENGACLIEVSYALVQIEGDAGAAQTINGVLQADLNAWDPAGRREQFRELLDDPNLTVDNTYFDAIHADVGQNADGVFSILLSESWYMGGVYNLDFRGLTFDAESGAQLYLEDLLDGTPEEKLECARSAVRAYVAANPDRLWIEDWENTLLGYSLHDMAFHVDAGQIWLDIPTYALAAGAAGAQQILLGQLAYNK